MSSRTHTASGAAPSFTFSQPLDVDDGKGLVYSASLRAFVPRDTGPVPVVSTGNVTFEATGAAPKAVFTPSQYKAVVTTLSTGERLVTLTVDQTASTSNFTAATTSLSADLPGLGTVVNTYVGATLTSAGANFYNTLVSTSNDKLNLRNTVAWSEASGSIFAFTVTYLLPVPGETVVEDPFSAEFAAIETSRDIEDWAGGVTDTPVTPVPGETVVEDQFSAEFAAIETSRDIEDWAGGVTDTPAFASNAESEISDFSTSDFPSDAF